jgi:hypothetical protein
MLQEKMDPFEKHERQDVQQVVCVFKLDMPLVVNKQYLPTTYDSLVQISTTDETTPSI